MSLGDIEREKEGESASSQGINETSDSFFYLFTLAWSSISASDSSSQRSKSGARKTGFFSCSVSLSHQRSSCFLILMSTWRWVDLWSICSEPLHKKKKALLFNPPFTKLPCRLWLASFYLVITCNYSVKQCANWTNVQERKNTLPQVWPALGMTNWTRIHYLLWLRGLVLWNHI